MFRGKLLIGFQIEIALPGPDREQKRELWPNANNLRLEAAHPVAGATVATNFFINVADDADRKLLRQKLRGGPIKVPVNTVLIIGTRVSEIISKPCHCGKFVTSFLIEVPVASYFPYCTGGFTGARSPLVPATSLAAAGSGGNYPLADGIKVVVIPPKSSATGSNWGQSSSTVLFKR